MKISSKKGKNMANIKQLEKIRKQDRISFVKYWADYMKNQSNKVWSAQQKMLIDSQINNAKNFKLSPKAYLNIKTNICKR